MPLPALIRSLSQPLAPLPTGLEPVLPRLPDIRAVVFDVYGTLFVSGSGDIGANSEVEREAALRSILRDFEVAVPDATSSLTACLEALVRESHAKSRSAGIAFPELEIRDLWSELLGIARGPLLESIATAYECVTNPVWPMPGARDLIEELHRRGIALGIVSNAQFYTPFLFEAFFERTLEHLGVEPALTIFSYQHGHAKPGPELYERLRDALAARELSPAQTLYLGNDALRDIHPAATLGFRTALFAGDQRSLRLHDDRADLSPPHAVVTELPQILNLLEIE